MEPTESVGWHWSPTSKERKYRTQLLLAVETSRNLIEFVVGA